MKNLDAFPKSFYSSTEPNQPSFKKKINLLCTCVWFRLDYVRQYWVQGLDKAGVRFEVLIFNLSQTKPTNVSEESTQEKSWLWFIQIGKQQIKKVLKSIKGVVSMQLAWNV